MASYYIIALIAVVLTAVSQILLKLGARRPSSTGWRLYLNGYSLTAYSLLLLVTLLNLYIYRYIPLKVAVMLLPLTLLLVGFFSFWLLHERLTRQQVWGAMVILAGVVVFNL